MNFRLRPRRPASPRPSRRLPQPGAAYLAAGTNLLDLMKGGVSRPDRLVDVTRLPGLDRIERLPDGGVRIGALVRNSDLAHDPDFAKRYPAVAEALLSGASAQLRNAATTGGNLLQRTRCPYFYDPASACNKREPGAGCDASGGEKRLHAVLGWSEGCIATHPSDFCVPLVGARCRRRNRGPGRAGARCRSTRSIVCPATTPERETVLEPGELIVALRLPPRRRGFAGHARYLKVRDRTSYAFAVVSAAAALRIEADRSPRRGSPSAASRRSRGGPARPRRCCAGSAPRRCRSAARPTPRSPRPSRPATTPTRSSSRGASSCAHSPGRGGHARAHARAAGISFLAPLGVAAHV